MIGLVLGAHGMLGRQLVPVLESAGHQVTGSDRPTCDLTDLSAIERLTAELRPGFIVNCAAYTKVDDAEKEASLALQVNSIAARNVAIAARKIDSRLSHISTDYVYGGNRPAVPVVETDPVEPCGVYGYSKYLGDELVRLTYPENSTILRTSWLHGAHGPNFVQTIFRLAHERPELKVVDDQFGSPTWAGWLSDTIARLIAKFEPGVFHASNRGAISWFDFATAICALSGSRCKVLPQSTAELARPAPRPAYSVLDCSKLERLLGEPCQSWEEGLKEHLTFLRK